MTLLNVDEYRQSNRNGKNMVLKEMERFLTENPVKELTLPCSEWDIVLYPNDGKPYVVLRKKA